MAYKITSACVSCGSCADACPAGAISQGDDQYVIDAAACLDCGSCSDTCPNGAIVFGDLNNPAHQVYKLTHGNPNAFRLLERLGHTCQIVDNGVALLERWRTGSRPTLFGE